MTISEGVERLASGCFRECTQLSEVTIPESITHIYSGVFEDCYSLDTVYYNGTQEQWDKVYKVAPEITFDGIEIICLK